MSGVSGSPVALSAFSTLPFQLLRRSWRELSESGERGSASEDTDERLDFRRGLRRGLAPGAEQRAQRRAGGADLARLEGDQREHGGDGGGGEQ